MRFDKERGESVSGGQQPPQHPQARAACALRWEIVLLLILKFDLLFFFVSVLAQEIFCKWVSEDELSPLWEADRRELCHVLEPAPGQQRGRAQGGSAGFASPPAPVTVPDSHDRSPETWTVLFP